MTIEDINHNMILIEKQQENQHYHQAKFINMNILQAKECQLSIKVKQ